MHVYFCILYVCYYVRVLRGPHGRFAMPNELPSENKDIIATDLLYLQSRDVL